MNNCFQLFHKLCLLISLIIFSGSGSYAQQAKLDQVTDWLEIEAAVRSGRLLRETLHKVNISLQTAQQKGDEINVGRSYYYTMLIKDRITQDTLYFRNSAFIDSLLADPKTKPVLKGIMHLIQARRITDFNLKYLKFNRSTYETKNLTYNYAALKKQQLDSVALLHWNQAALTDGAKPNRSYNLSWLSSMPAIFLFAPGLGDIAITEKIYNEISKIQYMRKMAAADPNIISYPSAEFMAVMDSLADAKDQDARVFTYYREWSNKYQQDPEKQLYIETCIRKYYYSRNEEDSTAAENYQRYLLQHTRSAYQTVRATAAFQLFSLYQERGRKYENGFVTSYSTDYKKALQVYEDNKTSLTAFEGLKKRTMELLRIIQRQQLEISLNNVNIPNAPILLQAKYQNVPVLRYKIIKVSSSENLPVIQSDLFNALYQRTPVTEEAIKLPDPADYNVHKTYLKLQPLPTGKYYLLFSGKDLSKDSCTSAISFVVSNITAVNADEKLLVLNRKSGLPLKGVQVIANYPAYQKGKEIIRASEKLYISDQQGIVNPDKKESNKILLVQGTDTLEHNFTWRKQDPVRGIFDKERYNNLEDFYDEEAKIMVYTDRGIYRPGQKVYFKAVLMSKNPKTGEQIIFNKDAGKAFSIWLKKNSKQLNLRDANNRKLDSVTMVTDDFGSFSGSFVLPQTAITGRWSITSDGVKNFYNGGLFSVEEYKRPTFELVIKKPEKQPAPGQPFELTIKVNSLSGADLGNVQLKYNVERSNEDPKLVPADSWRRYNNVAFKILDSTGFTNDKGELTLRITDTLLHLKDFSQDREWNFNYKLSVTAIESSGEQIKLNDNYSISSWPYHVSAQIGSFYEKQKLPEISPVVKTDGKEIDAGPLTLSVYEITHAEDPKGYKTADQWLYSPDELKKWFPDQDFKLTNGEIISKKLVYSEVLQKQGASAALSKANLTEGEYDLVITAKKQDQVAGKFISRFRIFDNQAVHSNVLKFSHLPSNTFKAGDSVTYYLNIPDSTYLISGLTYHARDTTRNSIRSIYSTTLEKGGLLKYQLKIPDRAIENLVFNCVYVRNNQIYNETHQIYLYKPVKLSPEIIVEKYRKVMAPGAKETFSVSVKTADKAIAAQLMTTIYDAALDKLEKHNWNIPANDNFNYLYTNWSSSVSYLKHGMVIFNIPSGKNESNEVLPYYSYTSNESVRLAGMVSGVNVSYQTKQMSAASSFVIRGNSPVMDYEQPLLVINGVVYEGTLKDIDQSAIKAVMVLKGADATALYGAKAAKGVLIINTKENIVLPGEVENSVVKVRKNFNETAVFIPTIYADKNGLYTFSFTMPESATQWIWKMLAHTKDGVFAYAEKKLNTRLSLMVQPHMPRLLYQGDELNLQSRLTNIDTIPLTCKATCKIEDAVTGEDLTKVMGITAGNSFSLAAKSNGYTAFKLKVPAAQVNPLKIMVTVRAGNIADAEEHIIPVMSKQIFVKQSSPLNFSAKDTVIQAAKLPDDSRLYGIALSINPKPQAALINALPWLADNSYDGAEQTFNKLLAHRTALSLMQQDKNAQKLFTTAKQAQSAKANQPEKENELPEDITKVVTPWLRLDAQQSSQQAQLFTLLDTVQTKQKINKYLQKLYELQNPDGGLPWFTGGKSNTYISNYILAGFGKLNRGLWKEKSSIHEQFITRLQEFGYKGNQQHEYFYSIYAQSFWPESLPAASLSEFKTKLDNAYKTGYQHNLKTRLLIILATTRLFPAKDPLYIKAQADLESIRQLAINDPLNGLRWKETSDQDNLDVSTEEMTELLAEAFSRDQSVVKGILKWLMTTRQDQHWATTTGTAAAVNLLMKENGTAIAEPQTLTASLAGNTRSLSENTKSLAINTKSLTINTKLTVSDDLLSGNLIAFNKQTTAVNNIAVSKTNAAPASGSLTWYYFTGAQNLKAINNAVKLEKTLQVYSEEQKKWISADKDFVFKIGMQVKVTLSIETPKPLTFVQLDDYRAAAFEPVEQKSGYQYQDKTSFYQSVRDTGYQIFTEFISSGKSEFSYQLKVVQEGTFANGPAVLSCMYKPEIAAYSNSFMIKTVK